MGANVILKHRFSPHFQYYVQPLVQYQIEPRITEIKVYVGICECIPIFICILLQLINKNIFVDNFLTKYFLRGTHNLMMSTNIKMKRETFQVKPIYQNFYRNKFSYRSNIFTILTSKNHCYKLKMWKKKYLYLYQNTRKKNIMKVLE